MTDLIREQSKWAREKTKVVVPYIKDVKEILSAIAGKGFSSVPGYLYEAQMIRELELKWKLSDVNVEILADTIERELKQQGITYDHAFMTAQMAWEIEKQNLLSKWDKAYAVIKANMVHDEELLALYALQLKTIEVQIIQGKYEIDLEAEGYRTQIAELDGLTGDAELALAQKKLLTAQKRLELIPVLLRIIALQNTLIVEENKKIGHEYDLITALTLVGDKKSTVLVPAISTLITAIANLKIALLDQKIQLDLLATAKENYATEKISTMDWRVRKAEVDTEIERYDRELQMLKLATEIIKSQGEADAAGVESDHMLAVSNKLPLDLAAMKSDDETTFYTIRDNKEANATLEAENKIENQTAMGASNTNTAISKSQAHVHRVTETANISAITSVTANLSHLLSM